MNIAEQPKLKFLGVDIIKLTFETEKPLVPETKFDLNIKPKVFYPKDNIRVFKIIFELGIKADNFFSLDLIALGSFEFDRDVNDEERKKLANINAPAIVFPYIRSFVSTLTSNLGNITGNIVLPTQFFDGILEEIKESNDDLSKID
ncbi:MAG: protein-export chaperone SecB [Balneolales bacterium]|nr:protein-export chaperone SecB [Balneolales bacterium]